MVSQEFGHQSIGPQEHLKKATVILNPAACKGYDYTDLCPSLCNKLVLFLDISVSS